MYSKSVTSYFDELDDPRKEALVELCEVISEVDPRITATIKWNAPSFLLTEHFATTGLIRGGGIRLVLHTGAKKQTHTETITIDDPSALLDWKSTDRALITFANLTEVRHHRIAVQSILRQWVANTQ